MRRAVMLVAVLASAACAPTPLPPADGSGWVGLPPAAGSGVLFDPDRIASLTIAATLAAPSRQEGDPVAQARALGWYEFATVALNAPRWAGLDPLAVLLLREGRTELRAAYGIRQDAPAQLVLDGFFMAAAALSVGDRAGAVRSFPPGILTIPGETVLARLAAPPSLPRVAQASAFAGFAVNRFGSGGVVRTGALAR